MFQIAKHCISILKVTTNICFNIRNLARVRKDFKRLRSKENQSDVIVSTFAIIG